MATGVPACKHAGCRVSGSTCRLRTIDADLRHLPVAKSSIAWLDTDAIFVGTDFGPGTISVDDASGDVFVEYQSFTTPPTLYFVGGDSDAPAAVKCPAPTFDGGDPDDPAQWAYIGQYSPYQQLEAGQDYPAIFIDLSTRDDRVHPGHARKYAARMEELGYPVWYWELTEGGHGASGTNQQLATRLALAYTHLWAQLGRPRAPATDAESQPKPES